MKRLFLSLFAAIFCCSQVFAFTVSPTQTNIGKKKAKKVHFSSEFLKKLLAKKSLSNGIEMISVTDDGERLSSVSGILSSPMNGEAIISARAFIKENAELFNLPNVRDSEILRPVRYDSVGDVKHVGFEMIIDGVSVKDARIDIHFDADNVVTMANGSLPTIEEIDNQISLEKFQAIGLAREYIKAGKFRAIPEAVLQILPQRNNSAKMVYVTRLPVVDPIGDWEVIVDAETGDILSVKNEMNFKTGLGALYLTNPLCCEVTKEPLNHLTTNTMTGKYAKISNDDGPESINDENVHVYEPTNTHFDEAGMYYYITDIHDFFKSIGHNKSDEPVKVVVHYGDNYDNAFFSPWQGMLAFGDGNKLNNLAREAAVAYHEYSHLVLNSITYLTYSDESGAINEGQADYFACSHTNDPMLGEWTVAKLGKPFMRHLENDLRYPEDIEGEVHADGRIWGAVLWDLRKVLGKKIADQMIYRSHYYLNGSSPKFIDGYSAIIRSDKDHFGGGNVDKINAVFEKRGIIASNYNGSVLMAEDIKRFNSFKEVHDE